MSKTPSEQLLSGLERSERPVLELFDDVTAIIGPSWEQHISDYHIPICASDGQDFKFRERWVLRWLIKKLGQAVGLQDRQGKKQSKSGADQHDSSPIQDERTWLLLNYLLSIIPSPTTREILIERRFCPILSAILRLVSEILTKSSRGSIESAKSGNLDDESGCPLKKPRLSEDSADGKVVLSRLSWPGLASELIQVATRCAIILSGSQRDDRTQSEPMNFAWAEDVDTASDLVGNILKAAQLMLDSTVGHDSAITANVSIVTDRWLYLWSRYISSGRTDSKQDSHASFNAFILIPAMKILLMNPGVLATEATQGLERYIAIHAVLPARSVFQKHIAAVRHSRGDSLRDKDIERLIREIRKVLQPDTNHILNSFDQFDTELLLMIASRLIPRSDVVRLKSESSWLEMLFLSLVQILFASAELRKPHHSDSLQLTSTEEHKLEQLIHSFAMLDLVPSAPIWRYFNVHYVLAKGLSPSYTLLRNITKINASVFVHHTRAEEFDLVGAMEGRIPLCVDSESISQKTDVVEILSMLLDEYGMTGQFPKFLELWKARLVETFLDRAAGAPTSWPKQPRYVWDDPDVLKAFNTACRQYMQPSLGKEILEEAERGLQHLPTLVGPAHQIFAQLTVATQVLKSGAAQSSLQRSIAEKVHENASFACLALARSTDYQGHRWRLYDFLATTMQIASRIECISLLESSGITDLLTQGSDPSVNRNEEFKTCAILMERYHLLHVVATSFENGHVGVEELLNNVVDMLNQLLEKHILKVGCSDLQSTPWNGTIEGIGQSDVFLSACLIRLASMPGSWILSLKAPDKLLTNLTKLISNTQSSSSFDEDCLSKSAGTLLRSVMESPTLDVQAIVLRTVVSGDGRQVKRLPSLLRNLPSQKVQRSMKGLGAFLLEYLPQNDLVSAARFFPDALVLLSTIPTELPNYLRARSNFRKYLSSLQKPTAAADLMTFICITQSIGNSAQSITKVPKSEEGDDEWRKNIVNICKILKKETKTVQSKSEQKLLDSYDGFLIIAVAMQLHCLQLRREDKKLNQVIDKIESRLRKQALEEASKVLTEGISVVAIVKATKCLDTVLTLANDKFLTTRNVIKMKELHEKLETCLLENFRNSSDNLEVVVLKWIRTELDRLLTLNQSILGLTLPTVLLTDRIQEQTKKGDFEVLAVLALDPEYLAPDATCAPLIILTATGDKNAFLAQGISGDTKLLFAVANIAKNIRLETLSQTPEVVEAFGQIASLDSALRSWTSIGLILRLELSRIIFEHHPSIINQHIIDSTLSNMILLASSTNKLNLNLHEKPDNPHPQHIFDRICQLLTIILTRHRRRLTGRHHLLLPALQSLLKCLFYPPTRQQHQHTSSTNATTTQAAASKAVFLSSLPHWLNPPTHTSRHTLPAISASKFSRVLQTLCDPSASSARRTVSKRRHENSSASATAADNHDLNLIDETRILRRQVAQHTQYLLQTYCQTMLDGWISPEAREKLALGLFAVCNATDMEVMRALNSAMDESQRAIWKDLYADWTRWGKWNQR